MNLTRTAVFHPVIALTVAIAIVLALGSVVESRWRSGTAACLPVAGREHARVRALAAELIDHIRG